MATGQPDQQQGRRRVERPLRLLFADDEPSIQELMRLELPRLGHEVTVCPDGPTAVAALERSEYDCLLVDLDMPGLGGLDVIRRARELAADTEAVIITGKSSLETAIAAVRQGVFDYLTKPCRLVEIEAVLGRVRRKRELTLKVRALERRLRQAEGSLQLIGQATAIEQMQALVARVAASDATVLVRGETGTGKELVARSIHDQSPRAAGPLVTINCGGLPEQLVESELFGHRRGAFTGADEHRAGLFEVADGGTLFLDEIGELPLALQSRLLRVLESGEIRRVGDNHPIMVDVRVVCATHRSLEAMVADGSFREDLLFRINTFEIETPPLRERLDDLPLLVDHFVRLRRPQAPPQAEVVSSTALKLLQRHRWPGNIRELANCIEHAVVLCDELPLRPEHLPARICRAAASTGERSQPAEETQLAAEAPGFQPASDRPQSLRELEMQAILAGLDRNGGNKSRTAEELGISLKTLYNKLNQLNDAAAEQAAA
jgi:DNA-binding NtrC family response regulator